MAHSTPSLIEFARDMRACPGFGRRVDAFETAHGPADPDTLAVLAQAAYYCWGNAESSGNLHQVARAIGTGRPTLLYYHCQITPGRWALLGSYVVGVHRWLGIVSRNPAELHTARSQRIAEWLGTPSAAKRALCGLFLCNLYRHLENVSIGPLRAEPTARREGIPTSRQTLPGGETYLSSRHDELIARYADAALSAGAEAVEDVGAIVTGISQPSPPPCSHRFTRYLDIHLTSIGALEWRGNLPLNPVPQTAWLAHIESMRTVLERRIAGERPLGAPARELCDELGAPSPRKVAMVRDFLLARARGDGESDACWRWLERWRADNRLDGHDLIDPA